VNTGHRNRILGNRFCSIQNQGTGNVTAFVPVTG
jgi:hypothetical protein